MKHFGRAFRVAVCASLAFSGGLSAAETTLSSDDGLTNYLYTPMENPDTTKSYWLVVGVHGAGGNGKGGGGVAAWATEFDDVLVLGPSFAQPKREPNSPRPAAMPRDIFQMSGPAHEAKLAALIAEVGKTWKLHPKIVIHGFSAGAQFAHRYAFKHPELVAAVSAHSGGSWATREGEDRINPEAKRIPFAISCGEEDRGTGGPPGTPTRIEGAKRFAADLESLGFGVEFKTWPGIGHEQTAEAKAMGRRLLEKVRTRIPPEPAAKLAPTRIYLAEDDHTDFMWTADAETYERTFVEMLDWHLKLADETAGQAPAYRHRFNCDGSHWLWSYEQRKTPREFARLIARVKDGTISAPLNLVVSCYGGQPAEAVLRGMSHAGRLERQHGLRFRMAVAMENQTLPLGLASLFAGSGARYSWRGVCGCASKLESKSLGERPREISWWTGHDGQRLLLKWHSLSPAGNQHSGGYAEAFDPVAAVRYLDSDADFLRRYRAPGAEEPYAVRGAFGFGWDALDRKTGQPYPPDPKKYPQAEHFHLVARERSDERRQVIVSNEVDFFEDFEKTHGASLDAQSVSYGNEWDLYSASMSETSARVKRAVEKLRAAELLAALVSLKQPDFPTQHTAARDRAFHALGLYWEHNWTADGPITRPQRAAWQEQLAADIETYVDTLQRDAATRLGGMIPRPENANRFFVLNPLGWSRTDAADFAYTGPADIHVRDLATGKDVPHQLVNLEGVQHLRILASDVPSAGYKVFEIRSGAGVAQTDDAAMFRDTTFENDGVKLIVERDGAIRSFIDKRRGNAELAATIGDLRLNDFAANSEDGEPLRVENRGPVSVTVRARSGAGLDHTTAITLYRGSERVDIRNDITANFSDLHHWAFSIALNEPATHTEEVGAVILAKLKSAGGDYADTQARYDYLTVNHFADLTDGTGTKGMTISNPDLAFARLGNSSVTHLDTATPQLHFLAGGQVDGPALGIRAQNGHTHFLQRFALRPHGGYDQTAAMKFALEHQNPFVTGAVNSKEGGSFPGTTHSLLTVSNPDALLWALKPHDDGIEHGLVARLWNLSNEPAKAEITITPGIPSAHRSTHLETDLEAVPLTSAGALPATFTRQQMQSYRIKIK